VLAQRIARVHRLGQREVVNVVLLVSEGGFEERMEGTLDSKRALFAAAIGDDAETTELDRSSMARRMATLLPDAGRPAPAPARMMAAEMVAPPATPDPVLALRASLGEALAQVLRLRDGRLVGVVRGAAPAAGVVGASLVPSTAVDALVALGDASPFAAAEILFSAPDEGPAAAALAARRALASGARRKRDAADALVAAGMACEALHLYRDAMALACRALDDRGDPGEEPAALLLAVHAHLVPSGALDSAGAAALTRGGELARAFARLPDAPP
jgi:hypothetical protein